MSEQKLGNLRLTGMVQLARKHLDRGDWDYLVGAADTEASLRRNRAAGIRVFKPRILNDVSTVNVASELLGSSMRIPLFCRRLVRFRHSRPEEAPVLQKPPKSLASCILVPPVHQIETVARDVPGDRIYQLYLVGDEAWMDDHIEAQWSATRAFAYRDTRAFSSGA